MALNRHPFDGQTAAGSLDALHTERTEGCLGIIRNIDVGKFPPINSSKFGDELKDLCYKCMTREPSRRPCTLDLFQMQVVREAAECAGIQIPLVEPSSPHRLQMFDDLWEVGSRTPDLLTEVFYRLSLPCLQERVRHPQLVTSGVVKRSYSTGEFVSYFQ